MPSTNETHSNAHNSLQNLYSGGLKIAIGASALFVANSSFNPNPALANTNDYAGHTVPVITSGERWSTIKYPWDGLNSSTGIYGGENGSETTADFTAQGDVPELGLHTNTAHKLSGLGFVKHGTGGFFYLPNNPSVATVKVDNEGRFCVIRRKDNKVFHALDFNDLMDKCRELNSLYASGQEPEPTQKIEFNSNLVPANIQREQDNNINRIVAITAQYGDDNNNDRLAEQVERLRRFAKGLNNSPKQILQGFSGLYITNTAEYGSIVAQRDQGAFNNPEALSPLGTIFGREQNLQGLSPEQKYATINRFKIRFNAVLSRVNEVIASNQNKPLSWRGTIAAYIALGGPIPEGVIGGEGARETPRESTSEGVIREERPRESNPGEESAPCTSSLTRNDLAQLTKEFQTQVALKQLNTGVAFAGDLTQLKAGDYNLKGSTDGELEARNCLPDNWRSELRQKFQYNENFSKLPLGENGGIYFEPKASKGGSFDLKTTNNGGRSSLIDSSGSRWTWDKLHQDHFDVELSNGNHFGVYSNGEFKPSKEFPNTKSLPNSYYRMINK